MLLYRVVSRAEKKDYADYEGFQTAHNTLEGKQFFKSEQGAREFAKIATKRRYRPRYSFLFKIDIDDNCFNNFGLQTQILDGFEAVTITEEDLPAFNNCVNFTITDAL